MLLVYTISIRAEKHDATRKLDVAKLPSATKLSIVPNLINNLNEFQSCRKVELLRSVTIIIRSKSNSHKNVISYNFYK